MAGVQEVAGVRVLTIYSDGAAIGSEQDATDLISQAWDQAATLVAVPALRLAPEFLDLSSGQAGAFIQKFVNYRIHLAVVGDLSAALARSRALTDFVREANRRRAVWFVADLAALEQRLAADAKRAGAAAGP